MRQNIRVAAFVAILLFCLSPYATPPLALAAGLVLALTIGQPFPKRTAKPAKFLLQACVVGLGFGMNLNAVLAAGRTGIAFTMATIAGTLILGFIVARLLRVEPRTAHLISSGTAICGGSAIAAVAPVVEARDEETSVALGTVFILNAIALFVFPSLGHHFALTQQQFGIWCAIAIHDTSSVVGAATRYGAEALQIATAVKLARALWIIPLTIGTALVFRKKGAKIAIPWFIFLFVLASVIRTYVPADPALWNAFVYAAKKGLIVTLFLIGAGLSRESLAAVGPRPLLLGVILWLAISSVSLLAVMRVV